MVLALLALAAPALADASGTWSALPSMGTARFEATAATLSDGRVLVAGGQDGVERPLATAEVYSPIANQWSAVAPMPQARRLAAAAALPGDRVLIAGGDDAQWNALSSVVIYDAATNSWSQAAPMSTARGDLVAASLPDGRVLVAGGSGKDGPLASAEVYDPATGSWSPVAPMLTARRFASAAPIGGGRVLVAGGWTPADPPISDGGNSAEIYDPLTGAWSAAGTMTEHRARGAAAPLPDGRVVLAGGGGEFPNGTAEIFDPVAMDSFAAASMASVRDGAVAAALPGGRVLVAGGNGGVGAPFPIFSGTLSSAEQFTPPATQRIESTFAPTLIGSPTIGNWLTAYAGGWNDGSPAVSYQWQRCRATCTDIGQPVLAGNKSANQSYEVTADDLGARIRVVEAAHDSTSAALAASDAVGPVTPPGVHLLGSALSGPIQHGLTTVAIVRDAVGGSERVGYRISQTVVSLNPIFAPVTGVAWFGPGQAEVDIPVPATDHGVPIVPGTLTVSLIDASPLGLVAPSQGILTLSPSDLGPYLRDPRNPLALPATPPRSNPIADTHFFADQAQGSAAQYAAAWRNSHPAAASMLEVIAREPSTARFGRWDGPYPGRVVSDFLSRASVEEPATVPMLETHWLVRPICGGWSDTPSTAAAFHTWITNFAEGIGDRPVVLLLEMDALITAPCLSNKGIAVRIRELRDAINVLSNVPHLVTYLDGGAADALPAEVTARLLRRAGVRKIQGFFLNSTHFDWTSTEIRYGERISRVTGGAHFIVNTGENGRGPLPTRNPARDGNEVLCNPPGRGLGPLPTTHTGYPNVDAFAWTSNPGESSGACGPGQPATAAWWPAYALMLVRNADFRVR